MSSPDLALIHGGGDIVGFLEGMLERARAGEIEAIAVATVTSANTVGAGLAFRADAPHIWARTLGAVSNLRFMLLTGDLTFNT